tara:strand:+ start:15170 stop:15454 length:285 start_codon:yes stop_codon:yes gene_type:complete
MIERRKDHELRFRVDDVPMNVMNREDVLERRRQMVRAGSPMEAIAILEKPQLPTVYFSEEMLSDTFVDRIPEEKFYQAQQEWIESIQEIMRKTE